MFPQEYCTEIFWTIEQMRMIPGIDPLVSKITDLMRKLVEEEDKNNNPGKYYVQLDDSYFPQVKNTIFCHLLCGH